MTHFDEITAMLYHEGQLGREQAAELRAHAEACDLCRALLGALERETRLLKEALLEAEEPVPARLLERPLREPIPWPWIAGFGIAAAGAYTLWMGVVEPLRQQLSQAGFGGGILLTMLFFRGAFWQGWSAMTNLIEWMAVVTLGIVVLTLVGRRGRHWARLGIVIGGLLGVLLAPGTAKAAEVRKGNPDYSLRPGEVVKHDLLVKANSAEIDGEVDGDLFVFAREVEISGHVTGDVIGVAREIRITGRVDGNIRNGTESLYLDGSVGKSITGWEGFARLTSKAQVGGSVMVGTDDLEFEGRVARDLVVFAKVGMIDGFVGGDARLRGGRLSIGPNAEIQGLARFKGPKPPEISAQAKLASPLEFTLVTHRPRYASAHFYWHQAIMWCAIFFYGLALILLMPSFFANVVRQSQRYGPCFGWGAMALVATPLLAIIACITLVGFGVGIVALMLYGMALFAAEVFVSAWLGGKLLGEAAGTAATTGRMALGLLILRIVRILPHIGSLIIFLAIVWGLGALVLALSQLRGRQPASA